MYVCRTINVSKARFYENIKRKTSKRKQVNSVLTEEVRGIFHKKYSHYGTIRIIKVLIKRHPFKPKTRWKTSPLNGIIG